MTAPVETIDSRRVRADAMDRVVEVLKNRGVIAYPTETVYGLGCDALCDSAVRRIVDLKGRDGGKPMLVLIGRVEDVDSLVVSVSPAARLLMDHFWPGPLTLVFEAAAPIPRILTGGMDTIGIRLSPDPVCRALLERFRQPLVSTSANLSGRPAAQSAAEVMAIFGGRIDLILDGGVRRLGVPSTVLNVADEPPRVLREGAISAETINDVLGKQNE